MGHTRQWGAEAVRGQKPKTRESMENSDSEQRGSVIRGMRSQKTSGARMKAGTVMRRVGKGRGKGTSLFLEDPLRIMPGTCSHPLSHQIFRSTL